jgi:hypothetical protein
VENSRFGPLVPGAPLPWTSLPQTAGWQIIVASLLKRWLVGTHHGGWGAQHAEAYLDEFIFRFNRRSSRARGLLFYRLLQNAVALRKTNDEVIVTRPQPQGTKRRGRARQKPYSLSTAMNTPAPRRPKS